MSRPWSNEIGFKNDFDKEQQQNQSVSYKSESNLEDRREKNTLSGPQSDQGNFLRSMFEDPSEESQPVGRQNI